MSERLCGICGETPVEPPHTACPTCFQRADWIAQNDPYWWMEGRPKPQAPGENGSGTS